MTDLPADCLLSVRIERGATGIPEGKRWQTIQVTCDGPFVRFTLNRRRGHRTIAAPFLFFSPPPTSYFPHAWGGTLFLRPGGPLFLRRRQIDLVFSENALTIKGEKKEEKEEKEEGRHQIERSYGAFQRRIVLPCEVDSDKAKATFKKGVLSVTLPKTAQAQKVKKIAISAAK